MQSAWKECEQVSIRVDKVAGDSIIWRLATRDLMECESDIELNEGMLACLALSMNFSNFFFKFISRKSFLSQIVICRDVINLAKLSSPP